MFNPLILEYIILGLALAASVVLAIVGKISTTDAVAIITTVVGYAVGSAKGNATLAAVQAATPVPSNAPPAQSPPLVG